MIGISAVAAAVLYYPVMKLYKYISEKGKENEEEEKHIVKQFLPAYRGKHKPHHRHDTNGKTDPGIA